MVDQRRHPGARQFLGDDRVLDERAALSAVLAGPRDADQPRVGEHPLGLPELGLLPAGVDALLAGLQVQQLAGVLVEQTTDAGAVGALLGAVVEVHSAAPLLAGNRRSVTPVTRNGQR